MHYASPKHERLYKTLTRAKGYPSSTSAALFLLTSDRRLWKCYCKTVSNSGIAWDESRNLETGWDGYFLERAALSIAGKSEAQITLRDLLDRAAYPQELLRLVITALAIARHEPRTTKNNCKKGDKITC